MVVVVVTGWVVFGVDGNGVRVVVLCGSSGGGSGFGDDDGGSCGGYSYFCSVDDFVVVVKE